MAKQSKKFAAKLANRVSRWEDLRADGNSGPNTKMVKGYAFHKPGSQNGRKGSN